MTKDAKNAYQHWFCSEEGLAKAQEIAKLFHPGVDPENIAFYFKYDWVVIILKKGVSKRIQVGLGLKFDHSFWGKDIKFSQFREHVQGSHWKIWRFADDDGYVIPDYDLPKEEWKKDEHIPKYQHLMKDIPKPTAQEMYSYYYED